MGREGQMIPQVEGKGEPMLATLMPHMLSERTGVPSPTHTIAGG